MNSSSNFSEIYHCSSYKVSDLNRLLYAISTPVYVVALVLNVLTFVCGVSLRGSTSTPTVLIFLCVWDGLLVIDLIRYGTLAVFDITGLQHQYTFFCKLAQYYGWTIFALTSYSYCFIALDRVLAIWTPLFYRSNCTKSGVVRPFCLFTVCMIGLIYPAAEAYSLVSDGACGSFCYIRPEKLNFIDKFNLIVNTYVPVSLMVLLNALILIGIFRRKTKKSDDTKLSITLMTNALLFAIVILVVNYVYNMTLDADMDTVELVSMFVQLGYASNPITNFVFLMALREMRSALKRGLGRNKHINH